MNIENLQIDEAQQAVIKKRLDAMTPTERSELGRRGAQEKWRRFYKERSEDRIEHADKT